MPSVRILTVCLGNICRSPLAAAAIADAADRAGVDVDVDSAGTGAWHVGNPPDARSVEAGARAGLQVGGRARRVTADDLDTFDLVVVMDESNLADVRAIADRHDGTATIELLRTFDQGADGHEVPDPYYGGRDGFQRMVELVLPAAEGVVEWARARAADNTSS